MSSHTNIAHVPCAEYMPYALSVYGFPGKAICEWLKANKGNTVVSGSFALMMAMLFDQTLSTWKNSRSITLLKWKDILSVMILISLPQILTH